MTDTKVEALNRAVQFHLSTLSPLGPQSTTPEQVVATAHKFEAFLDGTAKAKTEKKKR
jgi:hypothetical protein